MANLVCCECKKVIAEGIETASGLDSHTYCHKCLVEPYKQLLADAMARGRADKIAKYKAMIAEIELEND